MAITRQLHLVTVVSAGLLVAACGVSGATSSSAVTVTTAAAATAAVTPTPTPTPTPTTAAKTTGVTTTQSALAPLDLSDMRLWNYAGRWHASEWGNGMSPLPWKYDHVTQPKGTDTFF